jgi:hypothetical protein
MKNNQQITLLDPALEDNNGTLAHNLGDLFIYESVKKVLTEIFPDKEIIRLSSHQWFSKKEKDIMKDSFLTFVGGTNLLSSDIRHFTRFAPEKKKGFYFFPGFNNTVLLGAGWCNYQRRPDWATTIYYNRILHKQYFQSVRDSYSASQLKKAFITKTLNTCCPTTWHLDASFKNIFQPELNKILFTLTNYYPNPNIENKFLSTLLSAGQKEIFFFPQVKEDLTYLHSLDEYKKNRSKFTILNHNYDEFRSFIRSNKFNYFGSRLHGGIRCLQEKMPVMIIGVDNRAIEIKKDTNLNIIGRADFTSLQNWINNNYNPGSLNLPTENIEAWKNQFRKNNESN